MPPKCFGGLPGCTTTDSLLYLVNNIKNAWRRKHVATIVFLDIAGAFPNTVTSRLLLNMRKLAYPTELIGFFEVVLADHRTQLAFNGFLSEYISVDNRIGQGEPSSMILYLIYSHALVAIPPMCDGDGGAYVDNNFFMATGGTYKDCDMKLNRMLDRQEAWSAAHNSPAEITKFKCVRFSRRADTARPDFVCEGMGAVIKCSASARLLGVEVDQELCWHHHIQIAVQKGEALLHAANRLTRPSFGLPAGHIRKIYTAIGLPKVEYALPVWYTPVHGAAPGTRVVGSVKHTREIEKVQQLACKLTMGAFKSMSTDVLALHTNIPPAALLLQRSPSNLLSAKASSTD